MCPPHAQREWPLIANCVMCLRTSEVPSVRCAAEPSRASVVADGRCASLPREACEPGYAPNVRLRFPRDVGVGSTLVAELEEGVRTNVNGVRVVLGYIRPALLASGL
eukprot:4263253-Prymnesium_polylepis.1